MNDQVFGRVYCFAESESDPDVYVGKVLICDFERNHNGLQLDTTYASECIGSLINKPFVGKVVVSRWGEKDFTGHNVKKVKAYDDSGNAYIQYEFDTSAFGTFTNSYIEEIDGKDCIVADFVLWKRFTSACEVFARRVEEGTLYTSFEIAVSDSTMAIADDGAPTKLVHKWSFLGHCALGRNVAPAYDSSAVLEVASDESDDELANALILDSAQIDVQIDGKEDANLETKDQVVVAEDAIDEIAETEPVVEDVVEQEEPVVEAEVEDVTEVETSALTAADIHHKLYDALRKLLDCCYFYIDVLFPEAHLVWVRLCCDDEALELDRIAVNYALEGDEVVLGEPQKITLVGVPHEINAFAASLVAESAQKDERIAELEQQVASLDVYRVAAEQQAHEAEVSRLKSIANASHLFNEEELESAEMNAMFESCDENKLYALIAQRHIEQASQQDCTLTPTVETSAQNNLRNSFDGGEGRNAISRWLSGNRA